MRKLTYAELQARQLKQKCSEKLPVCAILNNIRSLYNVGSIFRSADGAGLEKLWLCGITGRPPSPKITKTALGAEQTVPWEHRWSAVSVISELREQGYRIVLLEQVTDSLAYQDWQPKGPVCFVVGNEVDGVNEDLVPHCDEAIEIDMVGLKNSLNVTVAFGIIAYHLRRAYLAESSVDLTRT